jgi:hypothetical protein
VNFEFRMKNAWEPARYLRQSERGIEISTARC